MSQKNNDIRKTNKLATADGFEEIFFNYYLSLKSYAMVFLFDDTTADDIIQDVFLNLWDKRNSFSSSDNPSAYLHKAIYNRCMNHIRQQKTNLKFIREKSLDQKMQHTYYETFDFSSLRGKEEGMYKILHNAIDELPEQSKRTFILSRKFNLKNREIADFLEISVKAVEKNLTKALKMLKKKLTKINE